MIYIEHIKYYSDNSKWLAKLFLQFCREYKCQFLKFESNAMTRRERFNWLVNHPLYISHAVTYFETVENVLISMERRESWNPIFYRRFMWRYFLIRHQKYIPQYFRSYIGVKKLVSDLKKEGTRNDAKLEKLLEKIISDYEL